MPEDESFLWVADRCTLILCDEDEDKGILLYTTAISQRTSHKKIAFLFSGIAFGIGSLEAVVCRILSSVFSFFLPLLSTNCWPTVFGSGRRKEEIQVTFHPMATES